jgi:NADPH:quinone reductase-like Zn-dependent oxidoreductase
MNALQVSGYGVNILSKLEYAASAEKALGPDDVMIKVVAAGLNPIDYKMIYGIMRIVGKDPLPPYTLGFDLAGIVLKKGLNVTDFAPGDEVYSKVPWEQIGTVCFTAVVRADMVAKKPKNISFIEASGLPLVGCTVFDSFQLFNLKPNSSILIHAGSGGIGSFAIQYAKYLGAYVYTTTSTNNVSWVKELGADRVIDYKNEDYLNVVQNVDMVYDTLGGKYTREAIKVVKKGGAIVSIVGHHDDETLKQLKVNRLVRLLFKIKGAFLLLRMRSKNIRYKHVWTYPCKQTLDSITALIEKGHIKPIVDRVYAFEKSVEAISYLRTNRAKGKVIIDVNKE